MIIMSYIDRMQSPLICEMPAVVTNCAIDPHKGEGVVYKGQKSHITVGAYHSNSSQLSLKFQVYPKYHWNKETYCYRLLMNYLMNITRCTTKNN